MKQTTALAKGFMRSFAQRTLRYHFRARSMAVAFRGAFGTYLFLGASVRLVSDFLTVVALRWTYAMFVDPRVRGLPSNVEVLSLE